VNLKPY